MNLLNQVRTTIARHNLFSHGDTVVVGVSGGPDSLTLLHCLRALREELQITLHVAHLNHQLRGAESDADAEFIAALAREWNLPATIEARDVAAFARAEHLSLEEAARVARYAFLAEVAQRVGARVIAVGHHADDQVETVLMHFLRGAGMAGLRGMEYKAAGSRQQVAGSKQQAASSRQQAAGSKQQAAGSANFRSPTFNLQPPTSNIQIVRPLLDVTRAEIEEYCKANALTPRFDRSNLDTTFFRNRLRQEVLPYLEMLNPNLREVLRRTARALADDYDFLQAQVRAAYARVAREDDGAIVFAREAWRALHPALQRGTLRAAVQQFASVCRWHKTIPGETTRKRSPLELASVRRSPASGSGKTMEGERLRQDPSWQNHERRTLATEGERLRLRADLRNIDWTHIENARRIAMAKGAGAMATLPRGLMLLVGYDEFMLGDEPRVRRGLPLPDVPLLHMERLALPERGTVELPNSDWVVETDVNAAQWHEVLAMTEAHRWTALLDLAKCQGEVYLRRRRAGDTFQPAGLHGHTKSLAEFMIDEKIPRGARDRLPLLVVGERIAWVCGWRVDERARVTEETREVWRVMFWKKVDR